MKVYHRAPKDQFVPICMELETYEEAVAILALIGAPIFRDVERITKREEYVQKSGLSAEAIIETGVRFFQKLSNIIPFK